LNVERCGPRENESAQIAVRTGISKADAICAVAVADGSAVCWTAAIGEDRKIIAI